MADVRTYVVDCDSEPKRFFFIEGRLASCCGRVSCALLYLYPDDIPEDACLNRLVTDWLRRVLSGIVDAAVQYGSPLDKAVFHYKMGLSCKGRDDLVLLSLSNTLDSADVVSDSFLCSLVSETAKAISEHIEEVRGK